jgi:hypothetical protein
MSCKSLFAPVTLIALFLAVGARAGEEDEYAELSQFIQKAVVSKIPKRFEDDSDWGKTIPDPGKLKGKRRVRVKVGGREELPNGLWTRTRVWFDDPAKDVRVRLTGLKSLDAKNVRLSLEAVISFHAEQERQRWRKGLRLLGFTVAADATVVARIDCDVAIALKVDKFPPEADVTPKVVACDPELKEFRLNRVGNVVLEGDTARDVGEELKGFLQTFLRAHQAEIRDRANQAIDQALREGKENIPAVMLLKFASKLKSKR